MDAPDLADPTHLRLSVIKSNLTTFPDPIGMRIGDRGIHFDPPPAPPSTVSELDRAVELLRRLLRAEPLPFDHILAKAQQAGLSEPSIRRAKKRLGIRSVRPAGEKTWYWTLSRKP